MRFEVASPESCGIDSEDIIDFINSMKMNYLEQETHSFMLIRHEKVVSYGCFVPYNLKTDHTLFSCSKVFVSTAIGFAINEGLLSVNDYISDYFKEFVPKDVNEKILKITIKHLLTMTIGQVGGGVHECGEGYDVDDRVSTFFRRYVDDDLGIKFRYDGYATYMLSALIQKVTGEDLIKYLTPRLFKPLNIKTPYHIKDKKGICIGYSGMRLNIVDFAKFGQLYFNNGIWNGKQILPSEWVDEASEKQIDTYESTGLDWQEGYCYQFWRGRHNTYRFCGAFGQMCVVMPDYDAIFVIQSGYDNDKLYMILDKFYEHILIKMSKEKIKENPTALKKLNDITKHLYLHDVYANRSELENLVSGKTYGFQYTGGYDKLYLNFVSDECHVKIWGEQKESFEFVAGMNDPKVSRPNATDFLDIDKGDYADFYATAYWSTTNELKISARIIGTPTILKVDMLFKEDNTYIKLYTIRGKLNV